MLKLHTYRLPPGQYQRVYKQFPHRYFHTAIDLYGIMYWVDANTQGRWDVIQNYPKGALILQATVKVTPQVQVLKRYQGLTSQPKSNMRFFHDLKKGRMGYSRSSMPDNCLRHCCGILQDLGLCIPNFIVTTDDLIRYIWQTNQMTVSSQSDDSVADIQAFLKTC